MPRAAIHVGDALDVLSRLPDGHFHTCVTSPPYWGLRDYGEDGQLGLEKTPEEYVGRLVEIMRGVRRVLRGDGTLWLNLGDSYANDSKWGGITGGKHVSALHGSGKVGRSRRRTGLKAKDLVGIPWRVALALQADGWYLRSDIIWAKGNPMPESVRDRPTRSHEYIFLLTKQARYFYDNEAIKEESAAADPMHAHRYAQAYEAYDARTGETGQPGNVNNKGIHSRPGEVGRRNARSVWMINTRPFPGAHFATFPPDLAERCILAGTSKRGCCPSCGAPWERQVERCFDGEYNDKEAAAQRLRSDGVTSGGTERVTLGRTEHLSTKTTGWGATCSCDAGEPVACRVVDPFCGAGTAGLVALSLGRDFVGAEINPDYAEMARARITSASPLFFDVSLT